ncbi:MAG: hypothetical protein RL582_6 [Bacteroidota bacterium]|jgi:hypothetical protein
MNGINKNNIFPTCAHKMIGQQLSVGNWAGVSKLKNRMQI